MTAPDFTFNDKTGELKRGGKVIAFDGRRRAIVAALLALPVGERIGARALADKVGALQHELSSEIANIRDRRFKQIGMSIEGHRTLGYRIIVNEIPKWAPTIPPPATIEASGDR